MATVLRGICVVCFVSSWLRACIFGTFPPITGRNSLTPFSFQKFQRATCVSALLLVCTYVRGVAPSENISPRCQWIRTRQDRSLCSSQAFNLLLLLVDRHRRHQRDRKNFARLLLFSLTLLVSHLLEATLHSPSSHARVRQEG